MEQSSETKAALKQVKIKTGVVTRGQKEYSSYQKEANQLQAKLDQFKAEDADEGKIRQANDALAETLQMLPICKQKLVDGVAGLEAVMTPVEELQEAEEVVAANAAISAAQEFLKTI